MGNVTTGFCTVVLTCLLVIPGLAAASEPLPSGIRSVIDAPRYKQSHWGILVSDLQSGETVYELNADRLFGPASTTKLFSTAAALDALGADYRFTTPIYRRGSVGAKGELRGDLILVASGDLTLGGRTDKDGHIAFTDMDHTDAGMDGPLGAVLTGQDPLAGLDSLARQVAAAGIRRVRGDVLIDDRLFEASRADAGFVRTPIIVNDNLVDFIITPTRPGQPAAVEWRPRTAAYRIESRVVSVAETESPEIQVVSAGPNHLVVTGRMPVGGKPSIRVHRAEDPAAFSRTLLIEALGRAGVAVRAPVVGRNPAERLPGKEAYAGLPQVAALTSPPFSETIKLILKVSHNLGADIGPLLVAARHGKRTFEEGMTLIRAFLERAGLDVRSISLADGQGGERSNLVTPRAAVQLLRFMAARPDFPAYHNAQPSLGVDGSLAHNVPPESPARGKVRAKTGTLVSGDVLNQRPILLIKALAGYLTTASGRRLVFGLYVNNLLMQEVNDIVQVGNDLGKIAEVIYLSN